jgi:ubiquinol-cytochrome c reductase cytochrome b subunit
VFRSLLAWIDDQTQLVSIIHHFLAEPLPAKVGWPHIFGSAALFLFLLQAATGIFLMAYYSPAPDHAYETVQYVTYQLWFGRLVRGLHHWGASLMLVMVGLHMLQVYVWGAYKRPRQVIWIAGVFLLLVTFGLGFTGYLLPWDQKAYWATVVGTNIAGSIPAIGAAVRGLIRGGQVVGAITLTRFFAVHVFIFPALLAGLIIFHIYQLRRRGLTPPWVRVGEEDGVPKPQLFYPDQALKDAIFALVLLVALLPVSWRLGAPTAPVANPADTAYVPRPEWYFLWLFELLRFFPAKWEFVGAILLPALAVVLLLLYPYLDANPERRLRRRPFSIGLALFIFLGVSALGVEAVITTPRERLLTPLEKRGQKVFLDQRCNACHGINGRGGTAGPDLARSAPLERARVEKVLVDPAFFNRRSIMPRTKLPPPQMNALVAYLVSLTSMSHMPLTPQVGPAKPLSHQEQNWFANHKFAVLEDPKQCAACHEPSFCQSCHQNRRPDSHLHNWMQFHAGASASRPAYCQVCHEKSFCDRCHHQALHTADWLDRHGPVGLRNPQLCSDCHEPGFCASCHRGAVPISHGPGWLQKHGRVEHKDCYTCHTKDFCTACHRGAVPASHGAGWLRRHGKGRQPGVPVPRDCAACHPADFCTSCHQGARPASHKHNWMARHGQAPEPQVPVRPACATCHEQALCDSCHGLPMPHPQDWVQTHHQFASATKLAPDSLCARCHKPDFCAGCHG